MFVCVFVETQSGCNMDKNLESNTQIVYCRHNRLDFGVAGKKALQEYYFGVLNC